MYHLLRQRNEEQERQHQRAIERESPTVFVLEAQQKREVRKW
jgi:hypothetical protein